MNRKIRKLWYENGRIINVTRFSPYWTHLIEIALFSFQTFMASPTCQKFKLVIHYGIIGKNTVQ